MNARPCSFPITLLSVALLHLLLPVPVRGALPRLGLPVVLPNRAVELTLTGQVGGAYTIEASMNLSNWFAVSSGIATNGLLMVRHNAASNYPTLFYRGKGADASLPPLTVVLKTDTNLSVSALASLDGNSAVLYGRDGTRFTLSWPSNSIPDASIITMTQVTNITGLPFARGTLGTVLLEPTNLVFWGAASLEIMFPSNINRREVISYFARGDGSAFQLTPDRVGTNRIVIPVTRSGIFGSSLATTQELANAARIGTGSNQPVGLALASGRKAKILKSATADCFPEKERAAEQARNEIDQARAVKAKEVAALLGAERQRQLANESDDSSPVLIQVAAIMCGFYTDHIAPRWGEAANNCALAEVLVQNTLSVERQRQLLGAAPDDQCPGISSIPFCAIFQNCLADIRLCCALGMKGPAKVAAVFSLQRQDALLGLNCISQAEAQEVIDLCTPNVWTGTFSMIETGSVSSVTAVQGVPGAVLTEIDKFTARFEGAIEESQEGGDPEIGFLVELRVVGQVTQYEFHKKNFDYTSYVDRCPNGAGGGIQTGIQLDQTEHSAAGSTAYTVSFIILPGGTSYNFFGALNYDPDNPNPPKGNVSLISYQDEHSPCFGFTLVKNFTFTSPSPFFGNATLDETSGSMTDPNVVSGSFAMDEPTLSPPRHLEFKWKFTRRVSAGALKVK